MPRMRSASKWNDVARDALGLRDAGDEPACFMSRGYGVTSYRYTVVNGRTVLVEPRTRRIVQIMR